MKKLEDIVADDYDMDSYSNIAATLLLVELVTSKADAAKKMIEEITGMDRFEGMVAPKSEMSINRGKLNSALRRASRISYNLMQEAEIAGRNETRNFTGNIPVILKFFDGEQLYNTCVFRDFLYDCYLAVVCE